MRFRSPRDGKEMLFTPEVSIQYQEKIGADLIMAFDECIYYGAKYEYTKEATERTHRWLRRCVAAHEREDQYLYGIIQGGVFKDLREKSAQFVVSQGTPGVAIGGVSVGETKKEMREQVSWVSPHLPDELPRHLLGIGRVEDILDLVGEGMDTFDCVEPSRIARNGLLYVYKGKKVESMNITQTKYLRDKNPVEKGCECYTCQNFSRSFLHHIFKERELLGYYLATTHNLFFLHGYFSKLEMILHSGKYSVCRASLVRVYLY